MSSDSSATVTALLKDWGRGDKAALDRLMPLVYDELRRLAASAIAGERPDHTLQPTAVVHEAYLRLVNADGVAFRDRAHFLAIAARMMRRVLIDHARSRRADKRGGAGVRLVLDEDLLGSERETELIALDDALTALGDFDERQCRIVELRFFGGLTVEETAEVVGISPATVKREWQVARAWLRREVGAP